MIPVPFLHSSGKQHSAVQEPVVSTQSSFARRPYPGIYQWQRVREAKNHRLPRPTKQRHFTKPEVLSRGSMTSRSSSNHGRVGLGASESPKVVGSALTVANPIQPNTQTGHSRLHS